jgi:hypothetical protein
MDNLISNFWKRQEAVDFQEYKSLEYDVYPFRKDHIFICHIIPETVIKGGAAYKITYLDRSLHLKGFSITTYLKEDKITTVNVFGEHPNTDLNTNAYCLPEYKKGMILNEQSLALLLKNLKCYYLDSAYFIPGNNLLEYKKVASIFIRFNEGEQDGR